MVRLAFALAAPKPIRKIRIVLVEPEGPINVGSVARIMGNFGFSELVLVSPKVSPRDETCCMFASHATHILDDARVVDSLAEALVDVRYVAATTARTRDLKTTRAVVQCNSTQAASHLFKHTRSECAILFGPERRGLSNNELGLANLLIRIPADDDYPVLNLSHSVSIICYELFCSGLRNEEPRSGQPSAADGLVATAQERELLFGRLSDVLRAVGYFRGDSGESDKMLNFRWMVNRLALTSQDVSTILGLLRRVSWALQGQRESPEEQLPAE